MIRGLVAALAVLALGGLAAGYVIGARDPGVSRWQFVPDEAAMPFGWEACWIETGDHDLLSYRHITDPGAPLLSLYIEGDGYAWVSPTELSDDPSPRSARVLKLAVQDDARNAAYLARPCMYLNDVSLVTCPSDLWSLGRYGEDVVAALDRAADMLKAEAGARELRLVGFSGGGTLAALVAARRDDVVELVTVSANLDHEGWTARHGVTPLTGSLNAADVAPLIETIPQVHYIGAEDTNVMKDDIEAFVARMNDPRWTDVVIVPEQTHTCCWVQNWRGLLAQAEHLMAD